LAYYFHEAVLPRLNDEQRELANKWLGVLRPLGQRFAKAYYEQIKPGLADGQVALVLSSELKKTRWHAAMPEASNPLPLPELVLVMGVRDAHLLEQGGNEVFAILRDLVKGLHELLPDKVPEVEIPAPQVRELTEGIDGRLYSYDVALHTGLDPQLAPNVGGTAQYVAFSLVPSATLRMLRETPLEEAGEPLESAKGRNLGAAWQFRASEFIAMLKPWVRYGFDQAERDGDNKLPEGLDDQVLTILDVLQSLRAANGFTYQDGPLTVSRARSEFRDLP
jgi:hypothetical protein